MKRLTTFIRNAPGLLETKQKKKRKTICANVHKEKKKNEEFTQNKSRKMM
jgi:hypothetical protein